MSIDKALSSTFFTLLSSELIMSSSRILITIIPFREFDDGEKDRTEPVATIVLPTGMGYLTDVCKVSDDSSMTVESSCFDRL